MLLFQLYPQYIQANIRVLIPLHERERRLGAPFGMMDALQLRAPAKVTSKRLRQRFCEFIACQVKTLSFLTYVVHTRPPARPARPASCHPRDGRAIALGSMGRTAKRGGRLWSRMRIRRPFVSSVTTQQRVQEAAASTRAGQRGVTRWSEPSSSHLDCSSFSEPTPPPTWHRHC